MTKPILITTGLALLGWSAYNAWSSVAKVTQVVQRVGFWGPALGATCCFALAQGCKSKPVEPELPPNAILTIAAVANFDADTEEVKHGVAYLYAGIQTHNVLPALKHAHGKLAEWEKEGRRIGFDSPNGEEPIATVLVYHRMQSSSLIEALLDVFEERGHLPPIDHLRVLAKGQEFDWAPILNHPKIPELFKDSCRQLVPVTPR